MVDIAQFRRVINALAVRTLIFADGSRQTTAPVAGAAGIDYSTQIEFVDDFLVVPIGTGATAPARFNGWFGSATGTGSLIRNAPANDFSAGHPGILRLSTGTTTSGSAEIFRGQSNSDFNAAMLPSDAEPVVIDAVVRVPVLPTAAQDFVSTVALTARPVLTSGDAIGARVYFDGANPIWAIYQQVNGGAQTITDAAVGPTADTWHHVRLTITGSLITLEVDGVTVITAVPDTFRGGTLLVDQQKAGGTTSRDFDVDIVKAAQTVPARFAA